MTKEMTINKLAKILQDGFEKIYKQMDASFDAVYERMGKGFSDVYERMATKDDLREWATKFATKEDLEDMEDRLSYSWSNEFDALRDDMRLVKTKLNLG